MVDMHISKTRGYRFQEIGIDILIKTSHCLDFEG